MELQWRGGVWPSGGCERRALPPCRVLAATERFLVLDKDATAPDSYEVLGVAPDVTATDVRKRYFKLSLTVPLPPSPLPPQPIWQRRLRRGRAWMCGGVLVARMARHT